MSRTHFILSAAACAVMAVPASAQSWISFTNQTPTRLVADASVGTADVEEKDFAWGDFDHDGDIDLVNVRKQPFSTAGRKRNVLFMNEGIADGQSINGVLVDRTALYATAATDGGQGMLDLTADRDVVVTDVNGDGWLDIVTATTYGQGLAKTISHPRVYMNLGAPDGTWLGFKYEEPRIPTLVPGVPNFCGVGAGDVTGDKAPDLYFVGYSGYPDRLLINDGAGNFTDQTTTRLTSAMYTSSFGTTAHIVDMNGDGKADIVKSENGPVKTHYNNGSGFFSNMQATYSGSAYNTSVGDLNGDGKLDIIVSDDGSDRYLLNTGNGGNGQANFTQLSFPNSVGFNGNSRFVDLNNDGKMDSIICDVDVDAPGCERVSRIYRNLGNVPNITMADQGSGGIPLATMTGIHDVAPIDIDGDGRKDLVIAKCGSLSIWMNQPPSGLLFEYPQGLPSFIPANVPFEFQVEVTGVGGALPAPGTGVIFYSINNAPFVSAPMTVISGNLYSATLPVKQCTDVVHFYISAQKQGGGTVTDPSNAPIGTYSAIAALGMETAMQQTFESDSAGWTVTNNPSLTSGAWEVVDPNGTINGGTLAAPEDDAGNGLDVKAFVTQNGPAGGPAVSSDVDGGPTTVTSPIIDLAGTDATIYYDRWFYCEDAGGPDADFLTIQVSKDDGLNWVTVETIGGTNNAWETTSFRVGQYVTPTSVVRVRFQTADSPNNSITEAGIDNFRVEKLICGQPCPADISGDGTINTADLLVVINAWGPCAGCPADLNGDNNVNAADLLTIINAWGPCP